MIRFKDRLRLRYIDIFLDRIIEGYAVFLCVFTTHNFRQKCNGYYNSDFSRYGL